MIIPAVSTEVTGETNLISHYGLEHSYQRFSIKKVKEQLSAFLPHLPGEMSSLGSVAHFFQQNHNFNIKTPFNTKGRRVCKHGLYHRLMTGFGRRPY